MFLSDIRNITKDAGAFSLAGPYAPPGAAETVAMQRLASTLAHDFNNLLAVVMSATEQLSGGLAEGSEARELAMVGLQAAERSAEMLARLVALTGRAPVATAPIAVGAVLRQTADFVRRVAPDTVEVCVETGGADSFVRADRLGLENALLNLCINASDAMPAGGRLGLEACGCDLGADAAARLAVAPGPYVRLSVADTGQGMPAEVLARATQPHFTTKGERGTGLGLSSVKDFAASLGGALALASRLGAGTTATLFLPRAETLA